MLFLVKKLLPAEMVMIVGIIIALSGKFLFGLPLMQPDIRAFLVFLLCFVPPYFVCAIIYERAKRSNKVLISADKIFRVYLVFFVSLYLCYALKYWSHLLNNQYYDDLYLRIDHWFLPIISLERKINDFLMIPVSVENYIFVFQLIFYIVFPVCLLAGYRIFNLCVTAFVTNLIFGTLCFSIAPALGPFIYLPSAGWHEIFHKYMEATTAFKNSGGADYKPENFFFILGAMPSFHISIPAIFTWYMWKSNLFFGIIGLLILVFCYTQAKFTGFHYEIDLIVGIILALLSILFAEKLIAKHSNFINQPSS